jgi:gliding motility-associated-like protein
MSEHPVISLGADITEGCSPITVNFNSAAQLASVTAWNFGNGEALTGVSDPQMTFDCLNYSAGDCVYQVSFTAISETNPLCVTTGYESITVYPVPIPAFDFEQQAVCFDEAGAASILIENISSDITGLNCSGGVEPYSWTVFPTGVIDCTEILNEVPNLIASGTGVFTIGLVVNDINGCTAQIFDDFEVYPLPTPEVTFLQNSICLPTEVEILNTSGGAAFFELDVPGFVIPNNFESPFTLDVIYPGIYEAEFTVTSDDGCSVTIEIDTAFQAWYPPIADFLVTPENITFLDPIVTFTNLSEGGTEYIWSFGDGEGASEVNPEHEYERADSYVVQLHVTNEYGCTDVATQTIHVNSELQIFVPNAFTPNNDGNNDAWKPHINGEEFILSYECWVYDRWGKLVFSSTNLDEFWIGDNTSDGEGTHFVSSTESFSWKIEIKQVDGRGAKIATGNVFLVR